MCVCVCITNTTTITERLNVKSVLFMLKSYFKMFVSSYDSKQSVFPRQSKLNYFEGINACEAHPCCCFLTFIGEIESHWRECVAAAMEIG